MDDRGSISLTGLAASRSWPYCCNVSAQSISLDSPGGRALQTTLDLSLIRVKQIEYSPSLQRGPVRAPIVSAASTVQPPANTDRSPKQPARVIRQ